MCIFDIAILCGTGWLSCAPKQSLEQMKDRLKNLEERVAALKNNLKNMPSETHSTDSIKRTIVLIDNTMTEIAQQQRKIATTNASSTAELS